MRAVPKYANSHKLRRSPSEANSPPSFMTPRQPSHPSQQKITRDQCKHPQVQIVSRDEEAEYVECKECGEVFESSEFKDMEIEEKKEPEED
jgi:hypothetical protein